MTLIRYEEEKFRRIYASLQQMGMALSEVWSYDSTGDDNEDKEIMDRRFRSFVQDLRRANIIAFNRQYDLSSPLELGDLKDGRPYASDFEFLRSLKGLRLNLATNTGAVASVGGCYSRLDQVLFHLMNKIIMDLPAYAAADTW